MAVHRLPIGILIVLLWAGCDAFQDSSSMKGEIQNRVKQFAQAAQTDVNGMLAMYDQGSGTVSIGNGHLERGMEAIRKNADTTLVALLGKYKYDLGSIEVTALGRDYALAVTPFVMKEQPETPFSRQVKGVSSSVWRKTTEGWKIIHEHESLEQ
jgi:ketosteroid isomerase-like protein